MFIYQWFPLNYSITCNDFSDDFKNIYSSKLLYIIIHGLLLVSKFSKSKFLKSRTNNTLISAYLIHRQSPSRTIQSSNFIVRDEEREGNCGEIRGARRRRLFRRGEGVQSRDKRSHEGGKTQGRGDRAKKSGKFFWLIAYIVSLERKRERGREIRAFGYWNGERVVGWWSGSGWIGSVGWMVGRASERASKSGPLWKFPLPWWQRTGRTEPHSMERTNGYGNSI